MADPIKLSMLSSFPDYTTNSFSNLQQGSKWREHLMFQHPMITHNSKDIWVGNVIECFDGFQWIWVLVKQFIKKTSTHGEYKTYVKGYNVAPLFYDIDDHVLIAFKGDASFDYESV